MTKDQIKKAKLIKHEIGAEKAGKVSEYISAINKSKRTPASVLEAVKDKFDLSTEQAGACWRAWQLYLI